MECFVIFVMAWYWYNATESKPHNVVHNFNEMLKSNLSLIFILFQIVLFGQSKINQIELTFDKNSIPEKIKKITQYKSDTIINIREFDSVKNLVFSYSNEYVGENWNNKYLTTIRANIFEKNNKISKSYYLHSNAGINIDYYEYDKNGFIKQKYSRNNNFEDDEKLTNTNPYSYIFKIESISDLINNDELIRIEKIADKYLELEKEYDSVGNLIKEISFNSLNQKEWIEHSFYDDDNHLIYSVSEESQNIFNFLYSYNKNKLSQSVRISQDKNTLLKEVDYVMLYEYDKKDRLIKEMIIQDGQIKYKYDYKYDKAKYIKKIITYLYNSQEPSIIQEFYYNEKGSVIKEKTKDYRTNEKNINKYFYKYEFY